MRTEREKMLAGELYTADDPELSAAFQRAQRLCEAFNQTSAADRDAGNDVLRELLGAYGQGCEIRPPLRCDYGTQLLLGDRVFVNFGLIALDVGLITIGDDVKIGPNVQLLTPTHPIDPVTRQANLEAADPITIEANVWIGGGAILLPGVTIGENSVIGAGSVVAKSIPPNVIAVGNPCRVIRPIDT